MKRIYIKGPLHKKIYEYIKFRKSVGFTMRNTEYVFKEFDDFLARQHPKMKSITRQMVIDYLASKKILHLRSRNYRVTILRGFCRYLYQQNNQHYIPEKGILPNAKKKVIPYILSEGEILDILKKIESRPKRKILYFSAKTVISLLSVTGLRISEACRLNISDVDFKRGILHIRRSKFYKSRIVPISQSAVLALIYYKQTRLGYFRTTDPLAPFFVNMTGNRILRENIGRIFRKAVRELKIITDQGTIPRIHDLRHTFATRSLERVALGGGDPEAHLPTLATFLGHANLDYTETYLHPSKELLREAGNRFNNYSMADHQIGNQT